MSQDEYQQFLNQYFQSQQGQQQDQMQNQPQPQAEQQQQQVAEHAQPQIPQVDPMVLQESLRAEAANHPAFITGYADFMADKGRDAFVRKFHNEIAERAFELFFPDYLRFGGFTATPIKSAKFYFEQAYRELLDKLHATGILESVDPELAKQVKPTTKSQPQRPYTREDYYRDYAKMLIKTTASHNYVDYSIPKGGPGFPPTGRIEGELNIYDPKAYEKAYRRKALEEI